MTRKLISSGSPYEATVGYSRAVVQGDWCFVAGTTGRHAETNLVPEDPAEQAECAFRIIEAALAEAGFSLADVVRATYYVTDRTVVDAITPVLGARFGTIRPAATMILCELISPEMKVEIEVTALRRV